MCQDEHRSCGCGRKGWGKRGWEMVDGLVVVMIVFARGLALVLVRGKKQ